MPPITKAHLAKMQRAAKAARLAKERAGRKCGDCGRKVKPVNGEYIASSTRKDVVYCWVGTGCWLKPSLKPRKVADL